jgi:hypothetical protein
MSPSSDKLVPFRWPAAWTDPALLQLFAGSPINCLLFESLSSAEPVAAAARAAGLTAIEWNSLGAAPLDSIQWDSPAPRTAITGLVWPRIKLSADPSGGVEAGPTGAPWIDSNTWAARLAAVRAPGRPVWLGFEFAKTDPLADEAAYTIAIADSAASGARWMITLDDGLSKGLPAANSSALKIWRGIHMALSFFERRRDRAAWKPWGSIGILSSFSGKDEFLGQEMLNLAARRNLLYRVLDRSVPASLDLESLPAILYVDSDPPEAGLESQTARLRPIPRSAHPASRPGVAVCGREDAAMPGSRIYAEVARPRNSCHSHAHLGRSLLSGRRRAQPGGPPQRSVDFVQRPFVVGALLDCSGWPWGAASVGCLHQPAQRFGVHGSRQALALGGHAYDRIGVAGRPAAG